MKESIMLNLLERFEWLLVRNRSLEAKRLVKQELENINGVTEQKCKKVKLKSDYCLICNNYNCNNK